MEGLTTFLVGESLPLAEKLCSCAICANWGMIGLMEFLSLIDIFRVMQLCGYAVMQFALIGGDWFEEFSFFNRYF